MHELTPDGESKVFSPALKYQSQIVQSDLLKDFVEGLAHWELQIEL